MRSWRKILSPVDFSDRSRLAAKSAAELGWAFGGELTLLHVWEAPTPTSPDGTVSAPVLFETVQPDLRGTLASWAKEYGDGVKSLVVAGTPWEEIVMVARAGDFDVIVMATHGRTGLKHALMGSVAEHVIRHAPCPVVVMKL
jgi:nucleotide-binding universal stress UspA family protein